MEHRQFVSNQFKLLKRIGSSLGTIGAILFPIKKTTSESEIRDLITNVFIFFKGIEWKEMTTRLYCVLILFRTNIQSTTEIGTAGFYTKCNFECRFLWRTTRKICVSKVVENVVGKIYLNFMLKLSKLPLEILHGIVYGTWSKLRNQESGLFLVRPPYLFGAPCDCVCFLRCQKLPFMRNIFCLIDQSSCCNLHNLLVIIR